LIYIHKNGVFKVTAFISEL